MTKSNTAIHGYVYCITNRKNKKQYVGLTTKSIEERFDEHCKADSSIGRAIREHEVENFVVEQLDIGYTQDGLCDLEVQWIDTLDTYTNGYNDTLGGEGAIRARIPVELTERQKRYIEFLKEEYTEYDAGVIYERYVLNSIAWYFLAQYKSMKTKMAKLILSFPKEERELLFSLDLVNVDELLEYAKR